MKTHVHFSRNTYDGNKDSTALADEQSSEDTKMKKKSISNFIKYHFGKSDLDHFAAKHKMNSVLSIITHLLYIVSVNSCYNYCIGRSLSTGRATF